MPNVGDSSVPSPGQPFHETILDSLMDLIHKPPLDVLSVLASLIDRTTVPSGHQEVAENLEHAIAAELVFDGNDGRHEKFVYAAHVARRVREAALRQEKEAQVAGGGGTGEDDAEERPDGDTGGN